MAISSYKSLDVLLRVVSILSVMCFLFSCASNPSAGIQERSSEYAGAAKVHTVRAGETLFSIAFQYGVDYKKLADFNGINPPYTIFPAQKIRINMRANFDRNGKHIKPQLSVKNSQSNRATSDDYRSEKRSTVSSGSTLSPALFRSLTWQWPASGKPIALFQGDSGSNKGIDLSGKLGEPVLAAASGRVVYAGSGLSGYGKLLIIKHNEAFLSAYAHNHNISVKEGDLVKVGQRIADMGSSGTDRVKLHFEIRSDGKPVDPLKFLPKRE